MIDPRPGGPIGKEKTVAKKKEFRLGIIGAGRFAEANLFPSLSLHFFDDVTRAAVCDLKKERAERLAGKYGWATTYTDYREMIRNEALDGVIVCLGARGHPEVVPEVLEMGLPVFLEKPSSIDVEGTEKIVAASRKAGKIVQVGHQKRHGLAYRHAREIVCNKKEFGNVIQIESKMHGFTVFPTFYTCMLEWQCHNLDLVISFGGHIAEIQAMSHKTGQPHRRPGGDAPIRRRRCRDAGLGDVRRAGAVRRANRDPERQRQGRHHHKRPGGHLLHGGYRPDLDLRLEPDQQQPEPRLQRVRG